jgi:hypothetical protein
MMDFLNPDKTAHTTAAYGIGALHIFSSISFPNLWHFGRELATAFHDSLHGLF